MPKNLTDSEVREYEAAGRFPGDLLADNPTLHFCPEWDFMLIDDGDPEFDACSCDLKRK